MRKFSYSYNRPVKMLYTKEQVASLNDYTFAYLDLELKNHILTITLNRPQAKNAMNEVLMRELAFTLLHAKHNDAIWTVVLAANGTIFCAGADLKTFMGQKDENSGSTVPLENGKIIIGDVFNELHKPCIAKVAKPVYAGGFLLLGGCTHVVAAASSTFTLSEVKRGIWPFQVMASLLQIMPERQALNWCIEGAVKTAAEAKELGLVTHLVADDELEATVDELTRKISENAPSAIRLGLASVAELKTVAKEAQHKFLHQKLMECIQTENAQEGIMAFRQKRKPNWK